MQPIYAQNVIHSMQNHPMSYMNSSPVNGLTYQYPGFLSNYTYGSTGLNPTPIPYSNTHYVTSNYTTPIATNIPIRPKDQFIKNQISRKVVTKQMLQTQQKPIVSISGAPMISRVNAVGTGVRTVQQVNTKALQGYSSIEYIPYESYYIDYEQRQFVQNVVVPIQKKITDYYALEHVVDYVPKQIQQTVIQMVPQEVVSDKLYYVPIQTQIVHLPKNQNGVVTQQQMRTSRSAERLITNGTVPINTIKQMNITPPTYQVSQTEIKGYSPQKTQTTVTTLPNYSPFDRANMPPRPVVQGPTIQNYDPTKGNLPQGNLPQGNLPQGNLPQGQSQFYLPPNAKMQYHHSTRTVRNLAPGEAPRNQTITGSQQPITPPQFQSNQANPFTTNLPVQPKDPQRYIPSNNAIDMVTSEHVDMEQPQYDEGSNNPPILNPPSTFTLGSGQQGVTEPQRGSLQQNGSSNQNSANFNQTKFNPFDPNNRISNGSIYDYDQLRDY